MPKKKVTKPAVKVIEPEPVIEEVVFEEIPQPPDVAEVVERATSNETLTQSPTLTVEPVTVSTPALMGGIIRVRNQGKPFPCDLSAYGYGMRWPTNAVYSIPQSKYIELLHQGLDGVGA